MASKKEKDLEQILEENEGMVVTTLGEVLNAVEKEDNQSSEQPEQEMVDYINSHSDLVPRNRIKMFADLSMEEQYKQLQKWEQSKRWREEAIEANRIVNKVKDLFEHRNGNVEDAKDVMRFCQDFIDNVKQREIDKLDAEIAKLQAMKKSLEE